MVVRRVSYAGFVSFLLWRNQLFRVLLVNAYCFGLCFIRNPCVCKGVCEVVCDCWFCKFRHRENQMFSL